ncbi:MAG TPA: TolC family outer membrane protein [Alcaligenes sp.]|nr:TolC family outer membrane protein [Alcaligenes sp.]HRL28502.1 TolC family outer membrane protein [Alcaligenes sp.]
MAVAAHLRVCILACGILSGAAQAQDLLQTWNQALAREPQFGAAQAARQADQERIPQSRAQLLPQITATGTAELQERRQTSRLSTRHSSDRALWSLSLSQPIYNRSAWAQYERAQLLAQGADVQLALERQALMLRVSQGYFDILAAQDALATLKAEQAAIDEQLRAADQNFQLGGTTITDTYEARSRLDLTRAKVLQAENTLQVAQDKLAALTLERPAKLARLRNPLRLPAPQPARLQDWLDQSSQSGLSVALADLNSRAMQEQLNSTQAQHQPTLALKAQTGSGSDQTLFGQSGGGPRSLNSAIGLELSIPIFRGGETSSQVREQTSRLQEARYQLQLAQQQAIQQTRQYFSGVTSGLSRVQILEAAEKSSLDSVKANKLAYEIGVRVNIDVLNAQQQLYETQRNLSQARYDVLMNSLRLKAASGTLDESDLRAVNQLLEPSANANGS